jgi:hypothetical protein
MSQEERDQMRAKLDAFSQRLDACTRGFKEQGELPDVHRALTGRIEQRRDRMQDKLAAAEAGGATWDVLKIELERDFGAADEQLLLLTERLDAEQMTRRGRW